MRIAALHFTGPLEPVIFQQLMTRLPEPRRERISRFRSWRDAHHGLFSELLARVMISHDLGTPWDRIQISRMVGGKPFLEGISGYHFNISHSGDWVLFASARHPVGIDVEMISNFPIEAVDLILSPEEIEYLERMPIGEKSRGFYWYWTLKECYGKAMGWGLVEPMSRLSISRGDEGVIYISIHNRINHEAHFEAVDLDSTCVASVCVVQSQAIFYGKIGFSSAGGPL